MADKRFSFKALALMVVLTVLISTFCIILPVSAADKGAWAPNTSYVVSDTVTYGGITYTCRQSHTSLTGWEPPNVPALWLEGGSAPSQVATPAFNPSGGTYSSAQSVTISCSTSGATIRYTTNGSEPTSSSTQYTSAISISSTATVKAKAFKSGMTDSATASATYTISSTSQVATPAFSPAGGTYSSAQNVTISCATAGATIRYTTDGSTPTASSAQYTGAISVTSTKTIKAIAIKSGMTNSAVATAAYTIGTGGGGTWGSKIFAPYVDVMIWPTFSINNCYTKTSQKYYTLAFVTSDGSGNPAWGGVTPISQDFYMDEINNIRSKGGDVIISFGGANGTELAMSGANTSVSTLQAKYQSVIDKYSVTWVDFDIEGAAVADQASIDRRNKAIKGLQDSNPNLSVAFCLPALPSGLTAEGVYVLNNAKTNGVRIDAVNVMAMDYGDYAAPNPDGKMGDYAIQAAQNTHNQCTSNGINTKIGVTPMIGRNDVASEVFYQSDAQKLLNWAQSTSWMRLLAMWSCTRDNGSGGALPYASPTCSSIVQQEFDFTNIFKAYK